MIEVLFAILVFPGFLYITAASFLFEYVDRKLHARFQNRIGPPWYQPAADFVKLLGKEELLPESADRTIIKAVPILAIAATTSCLFYIPLWGVKAVYSFEGDLIVVLYFLTIPTLSFFLGGWYSRSPYAMIGGSRALTQLFAYEVPLLLSVLSSALLANTWSLSELAKFYSRNTGYWLFNLIGFMIALIALLGKLEKVPFDTPEAETEIGAGYLTEYSGRLLAFMRLALNIELIVGASLLASVFLPWGLDLGPFPGIFIYLSKVLFIVFLITLARSVFARLRIDQMINFCWKYVSTAALIQMVAILIIKGVTS